MAHTEDPPFDLVISLTAAFDAVIVPITAAGADFLSSFGPGISVGAVVTITEVEPDTLLASIPRSLHVGMTDPASKNVYKYAPAPLH
jgi:hypothetical protein